MPEHGNKSAYSRWLSHNKRGPEPDPWRRADDQARTYRGGIADDVHRFDREE